MPSWLRNIWTTLARAAKQLNRSFAWAAAAIENWEVSRLVRAVEPVVIIIAIIAFSIELGDRQEERTVRAWQLLTTRAPGNSGKIEALEYLNSQSHWLFRSWWPFSKERVSLQGIDLTPPPLFERWKDKSKQDRVLRGRCPDLTYLRCVKLVDAILIEATLACSHLQMADLRGADLKRADLRGANLGGAKLQDAQLQTADLRGARLEEAKLQGANFGRANLQGASFYGAKLQGAVLNKANLYDANLYDANLLETIGLTCPQLKTSEGWEKACRDKELACGATRPQLPCGR